MTHIIINYSITVYSNPLTIKFIIPTVKTFPSFSGHLAVTRRQIRTQTLKEQLRKVAAKEQELVNKVSKILNNHINYYLFCIFLPFLKIFNHKS